MASLKPTPLEYVDQWRNGTEIKLCRTLVEDPQALFLQELISRWGLVAGAPDGEDSAGRQKLRLLSPEELVARAVETVKLTFDTIAKNDWLTEIPLPKPPTTKHLEEAA